MTPSRLTILIIIGVIAFWVAPTFSQSVHLQDGKTILIDQYGESWDITQAVSLGFKPEYFQYGIGRNTIRPMNDSALDDSPDMIRGSSRVIGIENNGESHAYSVSKLTRHEIANTTIGDAAVAVGY